MKAAVVTQGGAAPAYGEFEEPAAREGEVVVTVRASALSNITRGQAQGTHYSSESGAGAFVPGFDGAGALADGTRIYFVSPRKPFGAMAERAAVRRAFCVPLPDGVDDVTAAAIGNPGMSSWAALTERAKFVAGESVLVNGATGTSGKLAVRIAKYLGAAKVIVDRAQPRRAEEVARARRRQRHQPRRHAGKSRGSASVTPSARTDVSVVLDYLWGPPAERIIAAIAGDGGDAGHADPLCRDRRHRRARHHAAIGGAAQLRPRNPRQWLGQRAVRSTVRVRRRADAGGGSGRSGHCDRDRAVERHCRRMDP